MPRRQFVFSCPTFQGFSCEINVIPSFSLDDCVKYAIDNLTNVLTTYKFEMLLQTLKKNKYHIHGKSINDIIENPKQIVYVCMCNSH